MNILTILIAGFSVIAAIDRLTGNHLGMGKEFEKGFGLLGNLALSMIGMIVLAPYLARLLSPCFDLIYQGLGIDPSVIPASLFANDMGGAPLAVEAARDDIIGKFNALVVASMMGCTISFTIPCSMEIVKKEAQRDMLLGFLCGVVTIPLGCLCAGLALRIPFMLLLIDLLPLTLFSGGIVLGLLFCPQFCVKAFRVLGLFIRFLITVGLGLGIIRFLLGYEVVVGLTTLEEGAAICFNAAVVMTGVFPMVYLLSKILKKPLEKMGGLIGIGDTAALGFLATLANTMSTYEMMNKMDKKGVMLNAAILISAGFTYA
ncbi:MAG: ethanolamine utilization protein EutH, partial [Clostridia bacterium]|nr:ethanolamine utilization protein EutH [Clostridia bacterium]